MNDHEVGRMWDESAEAWTQLARAGFDVYRDLVNTPAFLAMLPEIKGLRGLDIGFRIERLDDRRPTKKTAAEHPSVADTRHVAYFLIVRCRKLGNL